ncbi:MAG: SH3 domain-containing protein [Chloroflexi bacterium]|nr:SH3 domain-containing protein [Chloroflexota bacterium]
MRGTQRTLVLATFVLGIASTVAAQTVTVTAAIANLRSQPNTASSIVTPVSKGMVLQVIGQVGDWFHVKTETGAEGFVYKELVSTPSSPPPQKPIEGTRRGTGTVEPPPPPQKPPVVTPTKPEGPGGVREEGQHLPVTEDVSTNSSLFSRRLGLGAAVEPVFGGFAPSVQYSLTPQVRAQGMLYFAGSFGVSYQMIVVRAVYYVGEARPLATIGTFGPYAAGGLALWRWSASLGLPGDDVGETHVGFTGVGGAEFRFNAVPRLRVGAELGFNVGAGYYSAFGLGLFGMSLQGHYFF